MQKSSSDQFQWNPTIEAEIEPFVDVLKNTIIELTNTGKKEKKLDAVVKSIFYASKLRFEENEATMNAAAMVGGEDLPEYMAKLRMINIACTGGGSPDDIALLHDTEKDELVEKTANFAQWSHVQKAAERFILDPQKRKDEQAITSLQKEISKFIRHGIRDFLSNKKGESLDAGLDEEVVSLFGKYNEEEISPLTTPTKSPRDGENDSAKEEGGVRDQESSSMATDNNVKPGTNALSVISSTQVAQQQVQSASANHQP